MTLQTGEQQPPIPLQRGNCRNEAKDIRRQVSPYQPINLSPKQPPKPLQRGSWYGVIIFLFILISSFQLFAQTDNLKSRIIGSAYQNNKSFDFLERICDEAGGRLAGTEANEKALGILKEELNKLGLNPIFEKFLMPGWIRGNDEVVMLEPAKRKLQAVALGFTDKTEPFTAGVIDAKWGQEEDYKDIDANGKIVLVSQEKPPDNDQMLRYEVIEIAAGHGAKAVLFINEKSGFLNLAGVANFQGKPAVIPAFSLTLEEGQWLKRLLKRSIKPKLSITTRSYCKEVESSNAIVTFQGKVKSKIVIGAHFDSWDISQGAVDNGYGTAILFDVARLIKECCPENYYTIELVWLNAEELGLWGSKRYVEKHKSDDIIAMINMDMTGSPTGFNAMGFDDFVPFLKDVVTKLDGFNLKDGVSSSPWTNSDHMYFMFEGIPSFTINGYLDKDMYWYYHAEGDTFDKVNKRFLSDAAAVVTVLSEELANNTKLPYRKLSEKEVVELLKKFKLDDRLKRQKEWKFKD